MLKLLLIFIPAGCPLALLPLLVLIEFISYLARNVSLGLRLAANILSGNMLLNILSGFTYNIMTSGLIFFFLGLYPLAILIALYGLKLIIAFIQAQVLVFVSFFYLNYNFSKILYCLGKIMVYVIIIIAALIVYHYFFGTTIYCDGPNPWVTNLQSPSDACSHITWLRNQIKCTIFNIGVEGYNYELARTNGTGAQMDYHLQCLNKVVTDKSNLLSELEQSRSKLIQLIQQQYR